MQIKISNQTFNLLHTKWGGLEVLYKRHENKAAYILKQEEKIINVSFLMKNS